MFWLHTKDLSTTTCKACIAAARADGKERFKNIFGLANNASELSGRKQIGVPEVCSVQRHCSNHPASSPEKFLVMFCLLSLCRPFGHRVQFSV